MIAKCAQPQLHIQDSSKPAVMRLALVCLIAGLTALFLGCLLTWKRTCIAGALAFMSGLVVIPDHLYRKSGFVDVFTHVNGCIHTPLTRSRYDNVLLPHPRGSCLGVVLPEQVTLPVPFTVWKHSGQADLFNILNAFLQILLQQLPLLLLLIRSRRRAAVLLDSGTGQRL